MMTVRNINKELVTSHDIDETSLQALCYDTRQHGINEAMIISNATRQASYDTSNKQMKSKYNSNKGIYIQNRSQHNSRQPTIDGPTIKKPTHI